MLSRASCQVNWSGRGSDRLHLTAAGAAFAPSDSAQGGRAEAFGEETHG